MALREQGRSFASIARVLGLEGAGQANAVFIKALLSLPAPDQENMRSRELARLDVLEGRLRQRNDLDQVEMARRTRTLKRLRKRLTP